MIFFSWLDFVPAQINGQKNTMAARNRGLWVGCTAVLYEYNLRYILNCCCWYSSTRYHDSLSKHTNKCLCIYRPHPISNIRPALNGPQKWPKSPKSKLKIGEITVINCYSKNHPLRFPFLHLYKQEIKIFQD